MILRILKTATFQNRLGPSNAVQHSNISVWTAANIDYLRNLMKQWINFIACDHGFFRALFKCALLRTLLDQNSLDKFIIIVEYWNVIPIVK